MKYITLSIKKVILFAIGILLISSPILGTRVSASSADNGESCLNTVITNVSAIAFDQDFSGIGSFGYESAEHLVHLRERSMDRNGSW